MQCETVELKLDERLRGELPPREAAEVDTHLTGCRSCAAWRDELAALSGAARRLMGESPVSFKSLVLDHYALLETAEDPLWVVWSERGVRRITLAESPAGRFVDGYESAFKRPLEAGRLPGGFRRQILDAFHGHGPEEPEVDLPPLGGFEASVLETLLAIPHGEVRSYAWVAREAGRPRAVRAVGNACARNPVPFLLPCHRVVPTAGGLGGYAFGTGLKRTMLAREGLDVGHLEELGHRHVRYLGSRRGGFYCFPTCADARLLPSDDRLHLTSDEQALEMGLEPCDRCRPLGFREETS